MLWLSASEPNTLEARIIWYQEIVLISKKLGRTIRARVIGF